MADRVEKKELTMPDLTPMIDVVFQLLIFFMVTAVFAITPGLDIKLPESEEAQAPEKENLFIVVDQDGNMKLNHKSVTFATLKEELQAKRQLLDNTTMIIIQGDERCHARANRPDHGHCSPSGRHRSGHRHGTAAQLSEGSRPFQEGEELW